MKMYRVDWDMRLEEFEVVKVTDKTVTYVNPYWKKETRTNKVTHYHIWFPTRAEAVNHIKGKLLMQIAQAHKNIAAARATLAELENG